MKQSDLRILVADANPSVRGVLEKTLTEWGYSVTVAVDGIQAWDTLRSSGGPRFAILDWSMTGLEGLEVCRRIRAAAGLDYIYTVILTPRSRAEDLAPAMDAGADDCLGMPFCPEELRARLLAGFRIIRLQERLIAARTQLDEQAVYDSLTHLMNRRTIVEALEKEIARARRGRTHLAVIIADIDHYKRINDTYGHVTADTVLREMARRMTATVRPYDSVGRYGGDEFLVIVPGCDLANSRALADRLRQTVEAGPSLASGLASPVTCSFGVAWVQCVETVTVDELLRDADAALYHAKRTGRNRLEAKTTMNLPSVVYAPRTTRACA